MHASRSLAVLATLLLCAASVAAQTWEYRSYRKGVGSTYDKDNFIAGTITVEENDGKPTFHMSAARTGVCYRGKLPATVTKTEQLTTIEVTQPVPGCEEFRYYIRNDGSGGYKETKVGDHWVKSRFDHGLTPVK